MKRRRRGRSGAPSMIPKTMVASLALCEEDKRLDQGGVFFMERKSFSFVESKHEWNKSKDCFYL